MKYKIIDNFLDDDSFKNIKSHMLGSYFPWFYNEMKTDYLESLHNFQFTHVFYDNYKPNSNMFDLLTPLIQKIKPSALIRIKANLIPVTDNIIVYDYHVDYNDINCKTAIFYLNTNNGSTILKNEAKINSLENRFVCFDSELLHTGTSCTDEKIRCVLNINYYE